MSTRLDPSRVGPPMAVVAVCVATASRGTAPPNNRFIESIETAWRARLMKSIHLLFPAIPCTTKAS
jgi:hypothetical protein